MAKQNSDLLASYEHDFTEHVTLLKQITEDSDPVSMLEKNQFALENAQKLLKQMEVEAMNFMDDDDVRRRISKHKTDFDKIRKQVRQVQRDADRKNLNAGGDDSMDTGYDMEAGSKQERILLHNRNKLEEAKQVGFEMDDMARDIKFNLRKQTDKLEKSTLKNLFSMQGDLGKSNRLVNAIKKQRFKNKLIMWGIIALLVISVLFVVWMSLAPSSTTTEVEYQEEKPQLLKDNINAPAGGELDASNEKDAAGFGDNGY